MLLKLGSSGLKTPALRGMFGSFLGYSISLWFVSYLLFPHLALDLDLELKHGISKAVNL